MDMTRKHFSSRTYSSAPEIKRKIVKNFIETSRNNEEADKVITENYDFQTVEEKIAFLKGMFNIEVVAHGEKDLSTYHAMLHSIRTEKC